MRTRAPAEGSCHYACEAWGCTVVVSLQKWVGGTRCADKRVCHDAGR